MMKPKMIVTDLDRTLLRTDKTISEYTANVLNRCKENGIQLVYATARPERATQRYQKVIAPHYVIADNGGTITQGAKVIRSLLIPSSVKDGLLTLFLSRIEVKHITLETGHSVLTNYSGPDWDVGWNIIYTDFSNGVFEDTPKLSVECDDLHFLSQTMQAYPDLHMYANSGESWHQIMCKDATKTNAIAYIAETLGLGLADVVAFGDDYNDIEMLQRCGIGVSVANGVDEAKAVANDVCDTNDNDGVAKWMEAHLLSHD